ncbi:hypothetical protein [Pseudoduganella chitinolytica]|uniref:Uncharacterized protein n=1 Tax=Pseudoduganella chitinolytica TaxID=34070 RepID=A0ABY8BJF1_9BURK|nr:hypothetical protein [Pseudoduganella chitinolytica]WEF35771.1 hypothetical protein PX653_13805 [Pseudoduganella chitinolytica]
MNRGILREGLRRAGASLLDFVLPAWARWLIFAAAGVTVYVLGVLHGERIAGQRHIDYLVAEAAHTGAIAQAQTRVVMQTEINIGTESKRST